MTSDTRDTEDIVDICRNYWRFDHSQQHTHSWHDREDFLRDHLVPFLRQHEKLRRERDDATADRDRLAAIVERLPRTADGVAVIAGDRAWTQDPELGATEAVVTTDDDDEPAGCYSIGFGVVQATAYVGIPFCYSTRAAAEAAAKGGK